MKSFFQGRQASFISISCKVKGQENAKKGLKQEQKNSCSRQCSSHKNQPSILDVSAKLEKKTRRQMRKCYLSKKFFTYTIYAGTSKAAHKVFQQRGVSSIREFFLLHNQLQLFAQKLWPMIGCVFN